MTAAELPFWPACDGLHASHDPDQNGGSARVYLPTYSIVTVSTAMDAYHKMKIWPAYLSRLRWTDNSRICRGQGVVGAGGGLIESGRITPVIDGAYPLTEAAAAVALVEEGSPAGKVIVVVQPPPPKLPPC